MVRGARLVGLSVALLAVRELAVAVVVRRIILMEGAKTLFLSITVAMVAITFAVEAANVGLLRVHLPAMTCLGGGKGARRASRARCNCLPREQSVLLSEIGRASCRERVSQLV